jgi:nitrite reductase (NADH) large subunit
VSKNHFVVIGNGPAGHHAALTLRERDKDARITLISRDRCGCYSPHLLPQFIAGRVSEEGLYVSSRSEYAEKGIKLRSGQQVIHLDPKERQLIMDHKEVVSFTGAVIAVGGHPRIPATVAPFSDLMDTLKTLEDARSWIQKLDRIDSVLMIGGDLTSLAVTDALLYLGKQVHFVLNPDAFWPLRYDREMVEDVAHRLSQRGVRVIGSKEIRAMARNTENTIRVQTGRRSIHVGMVGAFYGLAPQVGFLARSGLLLDRGVLVDEYLSTGFEGIYATGDCAQVYHPELRDYWISIGHENAMSLGRLAAINLVGGEVRAEAAKESLLEIEGVKVNTSWWSEF